MKLELKHIAPYLPYNLNCHAMGETEDDAETPIVFTLNGIVNGKASIRSNSIIELITLDELFPILRPLSLYYKGYTGKQVMDMLDCKLFNVHEIWDLFNGNIKLEDIKLSTYDVMCRNRIDFNNLIKQGLAIDFDKLN